MLTRIGRFTASVESKCPGHLPLPRKSGSPAHLGAKLLGGLLVSWLASSCTDQHDASSGGQGGNVEAGNPEHPAPGVEAACGSVRMTQYTASDRRWCGFDRTSPILPEFVQEGMTVAIAEPYAISSYGGEPGEACGECWELDTTFGTQLVMVHDLCPIEGNPVCAGGHFHFDVATEVAQAVSGGQPLGEGLVRRVPCPVSGSIQAYVSDRNPYGYLKLAFFNHRFPIRRVDYRAADADQWQPMTRCLARWCVEDDNRTFADQGPGGYLRLTSAAGESLESPELLGHGVAANADFDTQVQFEDAPPKGEGCQFVPPGEVYADGFGGIDGVRWEANPWGGASLSEVENGCAESSQSCLDLKGFEGAGLHLTYRHVFPLSTFSKLSLMLRSVDSAGTVEVAPRTEESRCPNPSVIEVGATWQKSEIDLMSSCPDVAQIQGLTISRSSGLGELWVDEVRFE